MGLSQYYISFVLLHKGKSNETRHTGAQFIHEMAKNASGKDMNSLTADQRLVVDLSDTEHIPLPMFVSQLQVEVGSKLQIRELLLETNPLDLGWWPTTLLRCGLVDRSALRALIKLRYRTPCRLWHYRMHFEQLFGPSCLGALVNRKINQTNNYYERISNRTIPVVLRGYGENPTPGIVTWNVCHGMCNGRMAVPCVAPLNDSRPMYEY